MQPTLYKIVFILFISINFVFSQEESYGKRISIVIGGPDWVVKSKEGTSCIVEVETVGILSSLNAKLNQNEFKLILRIKRGMMLLEYPILLDLDSIESIPTLSVRKSKSQVIIACKRHDDSLLNVALTVEDYNRLIEIISESKIISVRMNKARSGFMKSFEDAIDVAK